MAEDEDIPEDEFEDDDDSELFQPTPPDRPADDDAADLLGDALAHGAAGDAPAGLPSGTEEDSAEGAEEGMEEAFTNQNEAGEERDSPGRLIDDRDDSALFEPPAEEAPAPVGQEPVPPPVDEEDLDTGYVVENLEDSDLFSAASGGSEDENDPDQNSGGEDDEDSDGFHGEGRQRYPWLQTSGEEDEEMEEDHILQGRALIIVGAGVVLVIFAALIWFLYGQGDKMPGDEDVALIEAPRGPAKIVPEDRGGIEVPDQDKLVFDRVSGQETQMQDNLLDGPEAAAALPLSAPDAVSGPVNEMANALLQPDAAAVAAPGFNGEEPSAAATPAEAPALALKEVTPPPAAAPAPVVATRAAGGSHVVQLGSFGSVARAETAWLVMKNRHSIALAGLDSDIQRADLGARGVFYRLRTNALGLDDAQDLCAELKADGQDCLVVRR